MKLFKGWIVALVVCVAALSGCNSFERNAFNTLSASKAVIDQAQADYTVKTIQQNACTYAIINDAKAAQIVAVDAMVVYEQEKGLGQNLDAQTANITDDLAAIVPIVVQVKNLYTSPAACKVAPATALQTPPSL